MGAVPPEPFQVEIHIAGGAVVRFALTEERLRQHRHPGIKALTQEGTRDAMRAAAREWLEGIFNPAKMEEPVHVIDDEGALWIIAGNAVIAVRMFDPEATKSSQRVGFVSPEA